MTLLTEKELIAILKVSNIHLYKCRQRGMPYVAVGKLSYRYKLDDVLAWFEVANKPEKERVCK